MVEQQHEGATSGNTSGALQFIVPQEQGNAAVMRPPESSHLGNGSPTTNVNNGTNMTSSGTTDLDDGYSISESLTTVSHGSWHSGISHGTPATSLLNHRKALQAQDSEIVS